MLRLGCSFVACGFSCIAFWVGAVVLIGLSGFGEVILVG